MASHSWASSERRWKKEGCNLYLHLMLPGLKSDFARGICLFLLEYPLLQACELPNLRHILGNIQIVREIFNAIAQ